MPTVHSNERTGLSHPLDEYRSRSLRPVFAASQTSRITIRTTRVTATISVGASPAVAPPSGGASPSPRRMISGPRASGSAPSMAEFEYGILSVSAIPR